MDVINHVITKPTSPRSIVVGVWDCQGLNGIKYERTDREGHRVPLL